MTNQPRQQVRILSETPLTTYPRPDQPVVSVAITYQADGGPPRTVWVDQDKLPDRQWISAHPDGPPPDKRLVEQGDRARAAKIKEDLDKRASPTSGRTLTV